MIITNRYKRLSISSSSQTRTSWADRKIKDFKVWQDGFHPEELITNRFIDQKLDYVHNNAVVAGFVNEPHHYALSSAID